MIARKPTPVSIFALLGRLKSLVPVPGSALILLWALGSIAVAQPPGQPAAETPPEANQPIGGQPAAAETPAAPEPAEEPIYPSRTARDNQLLAQAAPEQIRWLETPNGQVLALYRPTETRTTKGVMLLLHAAETPPGWPPSLDNLSRNLPRQGWASLAIALPSQTLTPLPLRDTPVVETTATPEETTPAAAANPPTEPPAEPAAEPEPATPEEEQPPPPSRAELIGERVTAALAWLAQENPARIVLLVDNSSVLDSLAHLQTLDTNPVTALVLVNLQPQEALSTAQLETIFTETSAPVLDVFFAPEQAQMTELRKRHRAVALRNKVRVYHQLHLPPQVQAAQDDEKSFWVERVRGFIEQQK